MCRSHSRKRSRHSSRVANSSAAEWALEADDIYMRPSSRVCTLQQWKTAFVISAAASACSFKSASSHYIRMFFIVACLQCNLPLLHFRFVGTARHLSWMPAQSWPTRLPSQLTRRTGSGRRWSKRRCTSKWICRSSCRTSSRQGAALGSTMLCYWQQSCSVMSKVAPVQSIKRL
jgi:hypothetical protein